MSDPFLDYGKRATTTQPPALLGPIKLRAEARTEYAALVAGLQACADKAALDDWLADNRKAITQFAAEIPFLWEGDEDFLGLAKEIEWARARVDAGLDFPRWEMSPPSEPPRAVLYQAKELRS